MAGRKLVWQLSTSYLLIFVISIFAVLVLATRVVKKYYYRQTVSDLKITAELLGDSAGGLVVNRNAAEIDSLCRKLSGGNGVYLAVFSIDGKVLGNSYGTGVQTSSILNSPEIVSALNDKTGISKRYSPIIRGEMISVAIPIKFNSGIIGIAYASIPTKSINDLLREIYIEMTIAGLIIIILGAGVSMIVSYKISSPLVEMKKVAGKLAEGELSYRFPTGGTEEINLLAEAMNSMAAQLEERIKTIVRQRNEQEAVLSSMVEGVLAVDTEERIIDINKTAASMFEISAENIRGASIQEIIRNPHLHKFITKSLSSKTPIEGEIILYDDKDKYLQAHGTLLKDADSNKLGAVIVLHDITNIHRLEKIRRDFVANVSHELRTPITSIKGFVETLKNGALDNRDEAVRFLEIIERRTNNLNDIIGDLLTLSKLEQQPQEAFESFESRWIKEILISAVRSCSSKANEKGIDIKLICDETLQVRLIPSLLEGAVINLIDNAINYSNRNSEVIIKAAKMDNEVVISVADEGIGIGKKHLSRIFERFYRADETRDIKKEGTGLGLAIVKHIALIHGGRVSVDSTPGKGSIFRIHLSFKE